MVKENQGISGSELRAHFDLDGTEWRRVRDGLRTYGVPIYIHQLPYGKTQYYTKEHASHLGLIDDCSIGYMSAEEKENADAIRLSSMINDLWRPSGQSLCNLAAS